MLKQNDRIEQSMLNLLEAILEKETEEQIEMNKENALKAPRENNQTPLVDVNICDWAKYLYILLIL